MKNLYSIYDKATQRYGTPWVAENGNIAKRAFERLAADEKSDVHFRPGDFFLFAVGFFDDESGLFESSVTEITPPTGK